MAALLRPKMSLDRVFLLFLHRANNGGDAERYESGSRYDGSRDENIDVPEILGADVEHPKSRPHGRPARTR